MSAFVGHSRSTGLLMCIAGLECDAEFPPVIRCRSSKTSLALAVAASNWSENDGRKLLRRAPGAMGARRAVVVRNEEDDDEDNDDDDDDDEDDDEDENVCALRIIEAERPSIEAGLGAAGNNEANKGVAASPDAEGVAAAAAAAAGTHGSLRIGRHAIVSMRGGDEHGGGEMG